MSLLLQTVKVEPPRPREKTSVSYRSKGNIEEKKKDLKSKEKKNVNMQKKRLCTE